MLKTIRGQFAALCVLLALSTTAIVTIYGGREIISTSSAVFITGLKNEIQHLLHNLPLLISFANTEALLMTQANVLEADAREPIENYLRELQIEYPALLGLAVFDLAGKQLASINDELWMPQNMASVDPELMQIFRSAVTGKQGDVFRSTTKTINTPLGFFIASPITDESNLHVEKVLVIFYSLELIISTFKNAKAVSGGRYDFLLLEGTDNVVFETHTESPSFHTSQGITRLAFWSDRLANGRRIGVEEFLDSEGTEFLSVFGRETNFENRTELDWTLIITVPYEIITAPVKSVRNDIFLIAGLFAMAAAAIGFAAAHHIVRPLKQLVTGAEAMGAGRESKIQFTSGPREVAILSKALNTAFSHVAKNAAALERSTSALNNAQRMASFGSWEQDLTTGEGQWSDEMYRLLGYDPDAIVADYSLLLQHIVADERETLESAVAIATENLQASAKFEVQIRRTDGKVRLFNTAIVLEFNTSGELCRLLGVSQDITDSRQLEDQLRQAQKMEIVGQLTGGIAHDFNNLLAVILGNLELAIEEFPPDFEHKDLIDNALAATERGANLTHRLLAYSRRQPLQPRVVNLNDNIHNMQAILGRVLGEQVELEFVMSAGLWFCEADLAQMENVILNLAINGRDAMPGGGMLTIETANTRIDEEYAALLVDVPPGQYVLIAVTDTGTGMPPHVIAKVFDPFFTTKDVGKGSGLGLSMVHGFVKQSAGHIKIYSEVGEGTTVKIYLPRVIANEADSIDTDALEKIPQGNGEWILVVEDDPDIRSLAVALLRELGYSAISAHDGQSALQAASNNRRLDMLLTDVVLPGGMGGREIATAILEVFPGLPVLYMSGYTENSILHNRRIDPGVELLQKPFHKVRLAQAVRRVLSLRSD